DSPRRRADRESRLDRRHASAGDVPRARQKRKPRSGDRHARSESAFDRRQGREDSRRKAFAMKRILLPILGIAILIATVAQVHAMRRSSLNVAPPPTAAIRPSIVAEGRLVTYPGHEVTIGSDASGTIERLNVSERDVVKKGDIIAIVRADDTRAALNEAKAHVAEAEADIRLFQLETERAHKLWQDEVGSKQT